MRPHKLPVDVVTQNRPRMGRCNKSRGQFILIYNIIKTLKTGKPAGKNPWKANSLEWHTSTVPPEHGNFGERLPVVHRWPYDYSVPGAKEDFMPQTTPPSEVLNTEVEKT